MEIIFISALLTVEIYVSIRSWKILSKSKNAYFVILVKIVSVVFSIILVRELVEFLKDENGKSFTIGLLALELFLLNLFFAYSLFCLVLAKISSRIEL